MKYVKFEALISVCAKTKVYDAKTSFSRLATACRHKLQRWRKAENSKFTDVDDEVSVKYNAEP